jgi:hypothetical protein
LLFVIVFGALHGAAGVRRDNAKQTVSIAIALMADLARVGELRMSGIEVTYRNPGNPRYRSSPRSLFLLYAVCAVKRTQFRKKLW